MCGKSMKKGGAKKMAKGGSTKKMGDGGSNYGEAITKATNMFFPRSLSTGPNDQGFANMKKGGTKKAKFGASVPVRHSPPVAMRHNDERTGFESVNSKKAGGSLGMQSVNARIDKNKNITRADIIAAANKKKTGGMAKKATGGPILDKLKAKLAERKVTKTIKQGIKAQVKQKKKLG